VNGKLDECLKCLRSLPQVRIPELKPIESWNFITSWKIEFFFNNKVVYI
jgi:hypothetical protein